MKHYIPLVAALFVIAVGIFAQGNYSARWKFRSDDKLEVFTPRVYEIPLEFGDWKGVDQEIDSLQFEGSDATGAISRSYINRITGEKVGVYLAVGMSYHMTYHSPVACYPNNGYDVVSVKKQTEYDCGLPVESEFSQGSFHKQDVGVLQILWTYSDDSNWVGPVMPKLKFAQTGALYKLYIITTLKEHENPSVTSQTGIDFASEFLPLINPILFSEEKGDGDSSE